MAWTGNFKTQIEDLAGTLSASDDSAIQQWIVDGCYDVMHKSITKFGTEEIWKFAVKSGNETTNDIDVDEIREIAGVFRNGINAVKGKWHLKSKYADSESLYAATDYNPVWYLDDSKLSIYPAPSAAAPVNYYSIPEYSITNWDTTPSSVNNYPSEYYYHVMLYSAVKVLHRKMLDYAVSYPDLSAYITEMNNFIDDQEDSELSRSKMEEVTTRLQDFTTELQKVQSDYQWTQEQYTRLTQEYLALFA